MHENLKTEEILIELKDGSYNWGRRCPDCGTPCMMIREAMT